ncbi:Armadillo-type fold, partial [Cynara cardunculus var. scolymus]
KDSGNESRRERRKAARLEKNKKKFDSWVQHHQLLKKEKTSNNKKAKNAQKSTQIAEEKESGKEDSTKLLETSSPHTLKETISAEDDLKLQRRLAKKLRVKDKNLSEGILSALESLETEGGEASRNTSTSRKKHKRRISSGDDIMAGDDQTNMSFEPKVLKKRKTKFEKYLELDTQNGVASAQEDLALERKLAKKLKLKEGKLRGDDDELNMLFEGISSVFDSLETEENADMEEASEVATKKKIPRKKRKKNSEQKEDAEIRSEDVVEGPESEITTGAELDSENNPAQASVPEVQAKYVPPQLRSMSRNESEEYSQVRKRVRGLLNRLSESNVEGIAGDMSTIFQSIARSVGAQIISEEILASCSGGPRGNEQYAAVFAALVSGLACLVGIDFGAKLLASLANDLIYDFMMMLSSRLTEVDVSTILTILNCSGMRLRSDDPATMKNFILSIQNKVTELKAADGDNQAKSRSKRMEFMLETVVDIKNNKKRAKEDTLQHTRIKKWLQKLRVESILIRGLKWSKLIDPNKKGQWWLSGDMVSTTDNIENVAKKIDRESSEAQKMLQLAAGQRMNTDARRAIFCIDREIMRVLVECCLQEKVFNKYYCVLVSKLCSHDKNHKFTLQLIRSMHLAKLVAEMVAAFTLSLAVLKKADLHDTTQLTSRKIMHFKIFFEAVFEYQDNVVWNIFKRIAGSEQYEPLRTGIKFFVERYVMGSEKPFAGKYKIAKKALKSVEEDIF